MPDLTIRRILDDVKKGQVRIPGFQRKFVWDGDRVAYFMDSLFKGYPVGSLLLWRSHYHLNTENTLGPFTLPEQPEIEEDWSKVYYDFEAIADAQESQFVVLPNAPQDTHRYFPLRSCLTPQPTERLQVAYLRS